MANITCGNCRETHRSADDVRACHQGVPSGTWYRHGEFVGCTSGDPEGEWIGGRIVFYRGAEYACDWHVQINTEDGPASAPCGAPAINTTRGYTCQAGHSHVHDDIRRAEGWEYADGDGEALSLMKAGLDVVAMDGSSFRWGEAP
jgi:hypothetical protein